MAELVPYPFDRLIRRMFRELRERGSVFDLPSKRFFLGGAGRDLRERFHGMSASSPLGPAAGPHSQMAQNLVLAWLGGSRIQLRVVAGTEARAVAGRVRQGSDADRDAAGIGRGGAGAGLRGRDLRHVGGYDLEGIRSERVRAFIEGFMDARETVERLRAQTPDEFARFRDLEYPTRLSDSLTLSTIHGCPPDEIERIIDYLLREYGLNCVIKLNPTVSSILRCAASISSFSSYLLPHRNSGCRRLRTRRPPGALTGWRMLRGTTGIASWQLPPLKDFHF